MDQLETNIMNSFRVAKTDILKNRGNIVELAKAQHRLIKIVTELKTRNEKLERKLASRKVKKVVSKKKNYVRHKKSYVAAKGAKKFHVKSCPFAKNIHPKNKQKFSLKNTALNHGLKPCKCV